MKCLVNFFLHGSRVVIDKYFGRLNSEIQISFDFFSSPLKKFFFLPKITSFSRSNDVTIPLFNGAEYEKWKYGIFIIFRTEKV